MYCILILVPIKCSVRAICVDKAAFKLLTDS